MEVEFLMGFIGALLIGLVIGYFITDWYHKITKRVNLSQAQVFLLSKIAEQSGVQPVDIEKAISHAQGFGSLKDEFKK